MLRKTCRMPGGRWYERLCFNEAAAKCCGRLRLVQVVEGFLRVASMRPQQNAAEDAEVAIATTTYQELQ